MTYDDIIAGKAGAAVREVLLAEERGWIELLRQQAERDHRAWMEMHRIAEEWRKRATQDKPE